MHTFLYIHWDPEPSIFGFFSWYGLLFASSFAIGYWIMAKVFRTEGIHPYYLEALTIYMGLSTIIGARLGHCLFYDPQFYLSNPLEILMIWKGGLASHGAAIGIITGLLLWSRFVSKRSGWWILDRIVIMVALSGLFIRTGNLINSEILGRPTTSPIGFVFPREDQSDTFRARWEGNDVQLSYVPTPMQAGYFSLFRLGQDSALTEIPGPMTTGQLHGHSAYLLRDRNAGTNPLNYLAMARGTATEARVPARDSLDTQVISLQHEFPASAANFSGKWEGGKVRLHFSMNERNAQLIHSLVLMRSTDGQNWKLLGRGTLGGEMAQASFDTLDSPPLGANVRYRVLEKDQEIRLTARHAGMMYEAICYTAIFAFLLWLYFRKKGRVEQGLLFGFFLIMIFGVRFVIEFLKEDQEAFALGIPLNMGQLLSIPFVLAGIACVVRARRLGVVEEPPFPPVPASKQKK